tara:strand:- start:369 stop:659 length:291 start_codon:yes stop_codon:yes gene_type:complete
MSELVFREKKVLSENRIVEIKIWQVKKDEFNSEGYHYSLVYVKDGKRVLGYDNHERKRHHKHVHNEELGYNFTTKERLFEDFYNDLRAIMEEENEG